ncbi:interferon-induced protein with tetratricopeptide repeats 5-like [Heteronotia binoei]|uniref:interferon-induced protein with tetratricopeptide repeats 5-like n=1 Tax=Heteronotia binoei TaxID=13085 RepID=UPI00292D0270|nr:interferon-induced protein with tetratricopeptide repeats 5-like [Heteronotia binoei]
MKAYMHHLQGSYKEALCDLSDAEGVLLGDYLANFSCHALLVYGNFAWIYYLLANYEMAERYLGRIREICRSLSSPEPYSAQIPEIHAQRGWSLLVLGFQNGEEARECFQLAVGGDESNPEFQAGLAISVFASWTHLRRSELWNEATRLMEETLRSQPQNWDIKMYLAVLLQSTDAPRARSLVEDISQANLNPEVLRNAARLCKPHSLPQAVSLLQRAIALAPGYHLLHYDLGICHTNQLEGASPEEREGILAAAIESFQRAVEADPLSVFPKLALAKVYRGRNPLYAEEIYRNLLQELPMTSKRHQQAVYRHWGDFLLHEKGLRREALEMYQAGCAIFGGCPKEGQQLRRRVAELAKVSGESSARDQTDAVHRGLQLQPEL